MLKIWKWIKAHWEIIQVVFFWAAGLGICLWVIINMFKRK